VTTTGRLAQMTGAAVVPFFPVRLSDGTGYRIRILPALEGFPTGDDAADTRRVNALVETAVLQAPEQYLWVHRRFKTRPTGNKSFYQAS
ncbi:MAG: lipid A biosynthesis acyltransferase, partial [Actinobacteria bacterium]|nr:lipid A biosynthesis acyltransferase [Actinomycetota bacterium]